MPINLQLTNRSDITLYAHEVRPSGTEVVLGPDRAAPASCVAVAPNSTAVVATFEPTYSDSWGWIAIGRSSAERAYQLYCERTYQREYPAAFSLYGSDVRQNIAVLPAAVASAEHRDEQYEYTFQGQTYAHTIRLFTPPGGGTDIWQCSTSRGWIDMNLDTCGMTVDPDTTGVDFSVRNESRTGFTLDIAQTVGGDLRTQPHVARGSTVRVRLPAGMTAGGTWQFRITGNYDDGPSIPNIAASLSPGFAPAHGPARSHGPELPDPVFKITRSGGG